MGCLRLRCSCLTFRGLLNEAWFVMQVTLKQSKKRIFEEMQKKGSFRHRVWHHPPLKSFFQCRFQPFTTTLTIIAELFSSWVHLFLIMVYNFTLLLFSCSQEFPQTVKASGDHTEINSTICLVAERGRWVGGLK